MYHLFCPNFDLLQKKKKKKLTYYGFHIVNKYELHRFGQTKRSI